MAARAPAVPRTSPAALSEAASTTAPAGRAASAATWTSSSSRRARGMNPNLGRRRCSGIWPPSKPSKCMLPVRAFCPLPPRPAVLPSPEACPRPTRVRRRLAPRGALRWLNDIGTLLPFLTGLGGGRLAGGPPRGRRGIHALPGHEVRYLVDHPQDGRGVGEQPGRVALAQAQAAHHD